MKTSVIPEEPKGRGLLGRMRPLREIRNLGLANWLRFKYHKKRQNRGMVGARLKPLSSRGLAHPLEFRPGTSDLYVFRQVFAEREYACLDGCRDPRLIIDCGANVGYTSAYFLSCFPGARLIAVEPDPDNFALLCRNLAPYGDRVTLKQAAVWPHPARLVMSAATAGRGQEWGRRVRAAVPGETAAVDAVAIGSLLEQTGMSSISILKIDVEGAEAALFEENSASWLGKVDNLAIELHGRECEEIFFRAIKGRPYMVSRCGELTVCRRT